MVAQQIMVQLLVFQPMVQTAALGSVVGGGAFTSAWEIIMKINLHFKLQALAKISLSRVSPTEWIIKYRLMLVDQNFGQL